MLTVEQLGCLGPAPVRWEQRARELGVKEREAPPFVHQPGLGVQGLAASGRLHPAEASQERLLTLFQRGQVPRPADHLVLAANAAEGRGERHRARGETEFLDDIQRLVLPAEMR